MIKDAVILELSDADLEMVGGAGDIEIVNQQVSHEAIINRNIVLDTVNVGQTMSYSQVNVVDLVKKEVHLAILHATRGIHVHHSHRH